jgi:threonyl-tRNA synthetase
MEMHAYYYQLFGLKDYYMRLSLPDLNKKDSSKYIADIEMWRKAERYIQEAMQEVQMPYRSEIGEAAFYGPKIDVQFKNVFGREENRFHESSRFL